MTIGCVFAEDLHLGTGVAGLFTEKSPALIDFAGVTQLLGADGAPSGFFHRLAGEFFRIGVPGNPRHYPLRISAAQHGLDQRGGQTRTEAILLVAHGEPVIEVVIAIERDCHSIFEKCCRDTGTHILVVKHRHGRTLFVD